MERSKANWKWPEKPDEIGYIIEDIIMTINEPQQVERRSIFQVPEMKLLSSK